MKNKSLESISRRFNEIAWHDSKLKDFAVVRRDASYADDMRLELKLIKEPWQGHSEYRDATVILADCRIILLNLDLEDKRNGSDDIFSASCKVDTDLKRQTEAEMSTHVKGLLANYLHFHITMAAGGDLNIFAKDFELISPPPIH